MKIQTKIVVVSAALVVVSTLSFQGTVLWQRERLRKQMEGMVRDQAQGEATKIVQTLYYSCAATESRNQSQLAHDLAMARERLDQAGAVSLGDESVAWKAVNQLNKEAQAIQLPQLRLGSTWIGQNYQAGNPTPVVDEVRHLTRAHCTIFQRLNEQGDMLRVATSVLGAEGNRAIGTFIPHRNPDGAVNPVVESVLKGQTYRGRAFVVNEYYAAAYEPLWDAGKTRVLGMLFVGVPTGSILKEIHDSITKIPLGKSGYVYVLGAKGTEKGKYIVSQNGARDGESLWDVKDANGRLVIQSIVGKALQVQHGAVTNELYAWKASGEPQERTKHAVFTYFEPWDWVISAGVYQDDYEGVIHEVSQTVVRLVKWTSVVGVVVGLVGFGLSYLLARGITRPLLRVVKQLDLSASQTTLASRQVSGSSQVLAQSASEQSAALEETNASLEEISSITKRNGDHVTHSQKLSQEASKSANQGLACLADMNRTLGSIKAAVGEMQNAVGEMQASSQEISKIIKTIDEIAFQTNLLALNAAVEAARAGEAGMGFAVVADEVRALAQRSAQAARDTSEKIESAIKRSELGGTASGKVVASLGEVEANAGHIGQVFSGIVQQVQGLEEAIKQIATASREQALGVNQVSGAITEIDRANQSNAASAEETASAAEELNDQANTLRGIVAELQSVVTGQAIAAGSPARAPQEARSDRPATKNQMRGATGALTPAVPTPGPAQSGSKEVPAHRDIPMPALAGRNPGSGFKDF